jgi:hypothetical protein
MAQCVTRKLSRAVFERSGRRAVPERSQHLLDVSDLPPPEPLERVLDALADLPEGDALKVRLPADPVLLYPMLRSMGMHWERREAEDNIIELLIWEPPYG